MYVMLNSDANIYENDLVPFRPTILAKVYHNWLANA